MSSLYAEEEIVEEENLGLCKVCKEEIPLSDWDTKPIVKCSFCGALNNNLAIIESEPELYAPIPDIKVHFIRFSERISFSNSAKTFLCLGMKGSGKSSLLEAFSIRYSKIIDLYGSSDMECLAYCKPEFARVWRSIHNEEPRILLVIGETKDVVSSKAKITTCKIRDLSLQLIEDHDVITTVEQFFSDEDEYYSAIGTITNIIWKQRNFWTIPWALIVREASNWLYSRNKVIKNDGCAKSEFIKAMREARHHGLSVFLDCLRMTSLDKEIRDLADYTWIKKLGANGLPEDLHYLYKYFDAFSLMQMKPRVFALTTASGSIGYGVCSMPIWHKHEHENILELTGIEIKNSSEEVTKERKHTLGAFEHCQIIKKYMETKSMNQTAKDTDRSFKTVYNHITEHNNDVRNLHECQKCFNANVPFSKISIFVSKAGRPKKEKAYVELNVQ
jgi:hypothetical protein